MALLPDKQMIVDARTKPVRCLPNWLLLLIVGASGLLAVTFFFTGCSNIPQNSLIRDASITTPWGHTEAGLIATGTAANNISKEMLQDMTRTAKTPKP